MYALSLDDVHRAIQKLAILGNGYRTLQLADQAMLVSVPLELNTDHAQVLSSAQVNGARFSADTLTHQFGWSRDRIDTVVSFLLKEGLVWLDDQGAHGPEYWFPSLFTPAVVNESEVDLDEEFARLEQYYAAQDTAAP